MGNYSMSNGRLGISATQLQQLQQLQLQEAIRRAQPVLQVDDSGNRAGYRGEAAGLPQPQAAEKVFPGKLTDIQEIVIEPANGDQPPYKIMKTHIYDKGE